MQKMCAWCKENWINLISEFKLLQAMTRWAREMLDQMEGVVLVYTTNTNKNEKAVLLSLLL